MSAIPLKSEPSSDVGAYIDLLQANSAAYEWLVGRAQNVDRRRDVDGMLDRVVLAAQFAAMFHPGRFADGMIENLAFEIGVELADQPAKDRGWIRAIASGQGRRRVLHVASFVLGIGGHTRMLYHWMRYDQSSCHSLALVDQGDVPIPQWLFQAVRHSGGDLIVLPPGSRACEKAKSVRQIARRSADLVVLHHVGSDVVPTVAFAVPDCPPVALLNHADHEFWLGSSISDIVINLRTTASDNTAKRRFLSRNAVLPIPLVDQDGQVSRSDARRALRIPEDQMMLLSVGRGEKYRPCGTFDFIATAGKILDRQRDSHLYVVGESAAGIAPYLRCTMHERLHFAGSIEDPYLYRAAADIYLESFPFGSNTAVLEAALSGLPVVPAYAPLSPFLVAGNDAVQDLISNPKNEKEYTERVELLIQRPEHRIQLGQQLRERLLVDHVGEGWLTQLSRVYEETDGLTHSPRPIPLSHCSSTKADIGLTLRNFMADGRTSTVSISGGGGAALLRHKAFVAKHVGDYASARQCAWRAMLADPLRQISWRLLAVAMLGRGGRLIRHVLHEPWASKISGAPSA